MAFSSSFKGLSGLRQIVKNQIGLWVSQAEERNTFKLMKVN